MGAFWKYLGNRILIFIITVFLAVTVVFLVPRWLPGDPLQSVYSKMAGVGGGAVSDELIAEYRRRFGLDKSTFDQYISFWRELLRGNLGYSIASFPTRVSTILRQAVPWTIGLLTFTTLVSWLLGSLLGAMVGWSDGKSKKLNALVPIALVLYTTPYYILAILLVFLLAYRWAIFPLSGAYTLGADKEWSWSFAMDVLEHAALPALSIILVSLGWWFLSMRSLIISEKGQDYILWAEARGLPKRRIFWSYAFRNALLPQTTGLALSFGHIVGGALITEVIFAYPGLGYVIYNSIQQLDFPVIQGTVLLLIVSVSVANLLIDMLYPIIDPRIRIGDGGN
ncbi:MAG: ABC transporter permease [Thermomicrobiales bacterium]|nr:ABC transporter permease [Thermomicrobiales bacterium]MCC6944259.1 ABC transporter permease [Thermomicrobiales bacterium]